MVNCRGVIPMFSVNVTHTNVGCASLQPRLVETNNQVAIQTTVVEYGSKPSPAEGRIEPHVLECDESSPAVQNWRAQLKLRQLLVEVDRYAADLVAGDRAFNEIMDLAHALLINQRIGGGSFAVLNIDEFIAYNEQIQNLFLSIFEPADICVQLSQLCSAEGNHQESKEWMRQAHKRLALVPPRADEMLDQLIEMMKNASIFLPGSQIQPGKVELQFDIAGLEFVRAKREQVLQDAVVVNLEQVEVQITEVETTATVESIEVETALVETPTPTIFANFWNALKTMFFLLLSQVQRLVAKPSNRSTS